MERIIIEKNNFLQSLDVFEISNFIVEFECKYIEEVSLGQLRNEIEDYPYEHVVYTDDIEFEVRTMGKLLDEYSIPYKIEGVIE